MGRPPIGEVAMSGSERVRRWRLKHHVTKPVTEHPLEARIRELEAENRRLRKKLARQATEMLDLYVTQPPIFTSEEYKNITMCAHPDSNPSPETRHAAFIALKAKELQLRP